MSRKSQREALATLLSTITTFVAVYDRETPDFAGLSPVGMVHSDGTAQGPNQTFAEPGRQFAYMVSLWWKWDTATEDSMDELSDDVFDLLNAANSQYEVDGFSAMDYPMVDGVMYRREVIRVIDWGQ